MSGGLSYVDRSVSLWVCSKDYFEDSSSHVRTKAIEMSSQETTVAIIGAGARGRGFAALVNSFVHLGGKIVSVAEPREVERGEMAETYGIRSDRVFKDWQSFCEQPKLCEAVVIATLD